MFGVAMLSGSAVRGAEFCLAFGLGTVPRTLVCLASLGTYCLTQLELTGSIAHFIPSRAEAELVQLSLELIDSQLTRRMVLLVEGGPEREQVAARRREEQIVGSGLRCQSRAANAQNHLRG